MRSSNGDAASRTGSRNTFITGIAKVGGAQGADVAGDPGRLVILLDLAKVLSKEEQADLQAI